MLIATRWRWLIWIVSVTAWTVAVLYPKVPESGVVGIDEFISAWNYLLHKSVHVGAYAVMTLLTAWLHAPLRWRWLLVFVLTAHGTATEMGQWVMNEQLHWSVRVGHLHDVAYDNLGVLIGLVIGWKWWMRE
jgi:VanZ family protein